MDKDFFKKCWENKRLHALIVFLLWVVVLIVLMGLLMLVNTIDKPKKKSEPVTKVEEKEEKKENQNEISYDEKLQNLAGSNYEFTYLITKDKEKMKYEGTKEGEVLIGYKQDKNGIIKYKIDNQKIYQMLIDKEVEISNLYDGIDASLLNLNYVRGLLNQVSDHDIIVTEEESVTTYSYNLSQDEEELEITVIENKEVIEKITIARNNEIYELTYKEK